MLESTLLCLRLQLTSTTITRASSKQWSLSIPLYYIKELSCKYPDLKRCEPGFEPRFGTQVNPGWNPGWNPVGTQVRTQVQTRLEPRLEPRLESRLEPRLEPR